MLHWARGVLAARPPIPLGVEGAGFFFRVAHVHKELSRASLVELHFSFRKPFDNARVWPLRAGWRGPRGARPSSVWQ